MSPLPKRQRLLHAYLHHYEDMHTCEKISWYNERKIWRSTDDEKWKQTLMGKIAGAYSDESSRQDS
jgi:hypothetical protein